MERLPIVAIVGRPNVGKSCLFNRLVGQRRAIVADTPGVTRDRVSAPVTWAGRRLVLVDTGGLTAGARPAGGPAPLEEAVRAQALAAVREADLLLLVVDGRSGLHPHDRDLADLLRRTGKPIIPVVNKLDRHEDRTRAAEFYALGLGDPVAVSAEHGLNVAEVLDRVVAALPEGPPGAAPGEAPPPAGSVRVCVVGRPNVGKSSLVNRLLGEERVIVSEEPGTTREAVDARWEAGGRVFELVDTAGLRRRARRADGIERFGALRTLGALERCDVALLLLDGSQGVVAQDKRIAGYVHERGRACAVLVNKWDLAPRGEGARKAFAGLVRRELPFLSYAPVLFVSARTGWNLDRLPGLVARLAERHGARVPEAALRRVVREAFALHGPPSRGGRPLRVLSVSQSGTRPPAFTLCVDDPGLVSDGYERYVENRLREAFDFTGTPIRLRFRGRRRAGAGP